MVYVMDMAVITPDLTQGVCGVVGVQEGVDSVLCPSALWAHLEELILETPE